MSEMNTFEERFARRLRDYAAGGSAALRQETLLQAIHAGVRRNPPKPLHRLAPFAQLAAGAAALAVVLALALSVWLGSRSFAPGGSLAPLETPGPTLSSEGVSP